MSLGPDPYPILVSDSWPLTSAQNSAPQKYQTVERAYLLPPQAGSKIYEQKQLKERSQGFGSGSAESESKSPETTVTNSLQMKSALC